MSSDGLKRDIPLEHLTPAQINHPALLTRVEHVRTQVPSQYGRLYYVDWCQREMERINAQGQRCELSYLGPDNQYCALRRTGLGALS